MLLAEALRYACYRFIFSAGTLLATCVQSCSQLPLRRAMGVQVYLIPSRMKINSKQEVNPSIPIIAVTIYYEACFTIY